DRSDSYYQHWLAALEHLAIAKGLSGAGELAQRVQAWREAYLATPHGQPVELSRR
ncbi:MAG: nitrile hydratase accessory protein, partial [Pseudohongiellaceae bacterium]